MKCISLWQPWASLCVIASADKAVPVKPYETRSWPTNYRGKLLIHAAQAWSMDTFNMCLRDPFNSVLRRHSIIAPRPKLADERSTLPFGCIVGMVEMVDCLRVAKFDDGEMFLAGEGEGWPMPTGDALAFGDFSPGRYAWELRNPVRLEKPIPYKGRQGFFDVPDEVVAEQMKGCVV